MYTFCLATRTETLMADKHQPKTKGVQLQISNLPFYSSNAKNNYIQSQNSQTQIIQQELRG